MATEAQRQKQLLESGWLDQLGQDRVPLALNNVDAVFQKHMGDLLLALQRNVNEPGPDGREITASGNLSASMRAEYTITNTTYEAVFYMADYADFRDKGVQGIGPDNQNTTSPYRFKYAFPSRNMQKALLMWVRQKNVLSDIRAPKGLLGKHTRSYLRNKNRANSLAIALGVSIKRRGIKASNFKEASLNEVMDALRADLAKALAKDIVININTSMLY